VDLVAEEDVFLILVSPLCVMVGVVSGTFALPFTGAGLAAEAVGVRPQVSGIDSGVAGCTG
jgi:hypothetical protein